MTLLYIIQKYIKKWQVFNSRMVNCAVKVRLIFKEFVDVRFARLFLPNHSIAKTPIRSLNIMTDIYIYNFFLSFFFISFFFFFKRGCFLEWTKSGMFISRKCSLIIFISSRVYCKLCIGNCFECLDNSFWTNQKYELVIYCEFWGNKFDRENYNF